jgi:hypothetical protein
LFMLPSVYGVHDPMIAYSSQNSADMTCRPLLSHKQLIVYASSRYLPEHFKLPSSVTGPCAGLSRDVNFISKSLIRYLYSSSK